MIYLNFYVTVGYIVKEEVMKELKVLIENIGLQYTGKAKRRYQACIVECPSCKDRRVITKTNYKSCKSTKCNACKALTHGESKTQIYKVHTAMKQRCGNPDDPNYENYGGRGISVCKEWENYLKFKDWAISNGYEKGLTIDRINNDKGYSPENCRWETNRVQSRNRRIGKNNTSGYKGVAYEKRTKKWFARITGKNGTTSLGVFKTKEEAAAAYNNYVTVNKLEHALNKIN